MASDAPGEGPDAQDLPSEPAPTLTTLGEDLLLLILEHCDSAALRAIEPACSVFSRPPILEVPTLSLPERAAQATLRRHSESGAARPYDKGASETHKQVLALHERGLLKPGVLHDVPVAAVEEAGSGWIRAYKKPYKHRTCDADLDSAIPKEARYVMLGAMSVTGARSTDRYEHGHAVGVALPSRAALRDGSALAFSLLAWGRRGTVLKPTHDEKGFTGGATTSENLEGGVHWYRWPSHAIGFSTDPTLFLYFADSAVKRGVPEAIPGDRLSWNLESISTGGWRAGLAYDLGDSDEWLKCCYYRM